MKKKERRDNCLPLKAKIKKKKKGVFCKRGGSGPGPGGLEIICVMNWKPTSRSFLAISPARSLICGIRWRPQLFLVLFLSLSPHFVYRLYFCYICLYILALEGRSTQKPASIKSSCRLIALNIRGEGGDLFVAIGANTGVRRRRQHAPVPSWMSSSVPSILWDLFWNIRHFTRKSGSSTRHALASPARVSSLCCWRREPSDETNGWACKQGAASSRSAPSQRQMCKLCPEAVWQNDQ